MRPPWWLWAPVLWPAVIAMPWWRPCAAIRSGACLYEGAAIPNTGIPGEIGGKGAERVIRSPREGVFQATRAIGDQVAAGDTVGTVEGEPVRALIDGVLRGLLRSGLHVTPGFKTGDVDPRAAREHCFTISDKALSVAGGVLGGRGCASWRLSSRGAGLAL